MKKITLIFSGGTGGHVIPAVKFGNSLLDQGIKCALILDKRGEKYSKRFRGKVYIIDSSHLSGNFLFKLKSLIKLILCFFKSFFLIKKLDPINCISFGGYATFPPLIAVLIFNIFFKINIYLHEQNLVIGRSNLFFLPFCRILFTCFKINKISNKKYMDKICQVGMPANEDFFKTHVRTKKINEKKTIFLYGGSQGSASIINGTITILEKFSLNYLKKIKLIIQSPKIMLQIVNNRLENLEIDFVNKEFYTDIDSILLDTDIAITRGGAGTIIDLINYRIPSIIIPLSNSIYNHQYYNAKYLSDTEGSILINEKDLNKDLASNTLKNLIEDDEQQKLMRKILSNISLKNANKLMKEKIFNEN